MGRRSCLDTERFASLVAEGKHACDIAALFGVHYVTVKGWEKRTGLRCVRKPYTGGLKGQGVINDPARVAQIAALYQGGFTLQNIGDRYGITRERVRQILRKRTDITAADGGASAAASEKRSRVRAEREMQCLKTIGCTLQQYRDLQRLCREMRAAGVHYYRTPLGAYATQRNNAMQRGIGWELNPWQWWSLWQASGHWHQRGRGQGYAMCRKGDTGPYALGNVFIAPCRENSSDQKRKKSGLPIGVCRKKNGFEAYRSINGKKLWLGLHETPDLAHAAYVAAGRAYVQRAAA